MQINVFGRTTRNGIEDGKNTEENSYGRNGQPTTPEGKRFLNDKYAYLLKMSDLQLLDIMWESKTGLGALEYLGGRIIKKALKFHYKHNSGKEFSVPLSDQHWRSSKNNNRDGIMKKIQDATQREFDKVMRSNSFFCKVDCSNILDRANINFRSDADNLSLAIPMGGVQQVIVQTKNVQLENSAFINPANTKKSTFMDSMVSKNHNSKKVVYEITLEIKLRDRFAVDEGDFAIDDWLTNTDKTLVTALGREALTAFWILQHQRGYRPFVWNAVFQSIIRVY